VRAPFLRQPHHLLVSMCTLCIPFRSKLRGSVASSEALIAFFDRGNSSWSQTSLPADVSTSAFSALALGGWSLFSPSIGPCLR
jgi:hypothetical protein